MPLASGHRDRGARAEKEYLRWFPSLNASYDLRENLIARAAYYHSIGRPDFNQYAVDPSQPLLPDLFLDDPELMEALRR